MPPSFTISITESAEADLLSLSTYARRIVLGGIQLHLRYQPLRGTRRIKALRPNIVASWELRLGDYRVLYDVDEPNRIVSVLVVGEKIGNRLYVQGREYTGHESDQP